MKKWTWEDRILVEYTRYKYLALEWLGSFMMHAMFRIDRRIDNALQELFNVTRNAVKKDKKK